jgi:hypothetical protein
MSILLTADLLGQALFIAKYMLKGVAAMWQTGVNLTYENN